MGAHKYGAWSSLPRRQVASGVDEVANTTTLKLGAPHAAERVSGGPTGGRRKRKRVLGGSPPVEAPRQKPATATAVQAAAAHPLKALQHATHQQPARTLTLEAAAAHPLKALTHDPSSVPAKEPRQKSDSNWKRLQQKIARPKPANTLKPRAPLTKVLAIDCEMVGVGPKGADSRLARYGIMGATVHPPFTILKRVAIVNARSDVVLDTFVAVDERVTDFRTRWSGVRPADLTKAPPFPSVRATVARLVAGRVLVGHAIQNDLDALQLEHADVRDTSKVPALRRVLPNGRTMARSLKQLATEEVGLDIQHSEHSPVEDARAALYLYHKYCTWFSS